MRPRLDVRWLALCVIFVAVCARPAAAAAPALGLSARTLSAGGDLTVTFRLARPATVEFSIVRTPGRRAVGAFAVRGRAGKNRFLFPGGVDRRLLPPGRYRLVAELDGADVVSPTFRVVAASADPREAEAGRDTRRTLVLVFLLLAILLLGLAALPGRVVPGARGPELLAARRPGLTAAGFVGLGIAFALFAAGA